MKTDSPLVILAVLIFCMTTRALTAAPNLQPLGGNMTQKQPAIAAPPHDFDFLVGRWNVHHRRLKERLAGSHEWIEFEGSAVTQKILGGFGTLDDTTIDFPEGGWRGAGLRAFDPQSGQWSIWWLDSRMPLGPLDPPMRGGFHDGIGTFNAEEMIDGKPTRVRFIWSRITPTSCRWEQAFSIDGGVHWETNWVMDFTRA